MVDRPLALHLLGGHVRRRSEHRSFSCEASRLLVGLHRRVELGEAEVEQLGNFVAVVALHDEDVLGLEIAVDDAGSVGLHEPLGAVADDAARGRRVDEADAGHPVVERLAVEELHGDVGPAVFEAPRVVHVDDVGALHARGGARLAEEPLDDDVRVRQLLGEHLERHALAEGDLLGLVDRGHSPTPDLARDAVFSDEHGPDRNLRLVGNGSDGGHAGKRA